MSNRTIVELNHDYSPGCKFHGSEEEWLKKMMAYYRSGRKEDLPQGVTFKHFRHHSDKDPMEGYGDPS